MTDDGDRLEPGPTLSTKRLVRADRLRNGLRVDFSPAEWEERSALQAEIRTADAERRHEIHRRLFEIDHGHKAAKIPAWVRSLAKVGAP